MRDEGVPARPGVPRPEIEDEVEPPAGRLARLYAWICVRLSPLLVLGVLAAAAGSYWLLPTIANAPAASMDNLLPKNPQALQVQRDAIDRFGVPLLTPFAVVQRDPDGLSAAVQKKTVQKAIRIDRDTNAPSNFRGLVAVPVFNTLQIFPGSREHGTTAVTYLFFRGSTEADTAYRLSKDYADYLGPDLHVVGATGAIPARIEQYNVLDSRLHWTEGATVLLILLIVGLAFRAVLAPVLTVLTAAIAFVISQHVLGYLGGRTGISMPSELTAVAVALMLGVVTDYSVFFYTGTRHRLHAGDRKGEAVRRTTRTYLPIVFTAGLVVSVGVASLMLGTLGFFRGFGPGMAITVATGLLVSILFVPPMLALFGRAIFWPGVSLGPVGISRWRQRLWRFLTARPVALVTVVLCTAALVAAAVLGLRHYGLGLSLIRGLPSSNPVAHAEAQARKGFAPGIVAPTELLLTRDNIASRQDGLVRLQREIAREPGVAGVLGPADQPTSKKLGLALAPQGNAARYLVVFDAEPTEAPALDDLRRLRHDLPQMLDRAGLGGAQAGWAGETALGLETVDATNTSLWRVLLAAFGVNLIFLIVFLRSLLAPVYLLAASALGLAATFGLTLLFFGNVLHEPGLPYYLPVAFSVLLLSLGSDYNLFVVGRIWQEADRRPLREAVAYAAPRSSRAITIAGAALAFSFAMLAIVPITPFAVMAFAMAVGILLDTLVVRTLLVPGLIVLFGRAGRWPRRSAVPSAEPAADEPITRDATGLEPADAAGAERAPRG